MVYRLLILEPGLERSDELFHLVALVILLSILAHSSTDVLVARQFEDVPGPEPRASTARQPRQRALRFVPEIAALHPRARLRADSKGW